MNDTGTSIRTSIVVDTSIDRAFATFTEDIGSWWPPEHHILEAELAEMVFEPRVGGNVYDRGVDGSECRWARVLAYEPPNRIVISWDISLRWQLEDDVRKSSEVEVRFVPETPERTRVELEHRHIDRHGEGWENMRDSVGSPEGWDIGLQRFATRVARAQAPNVMRGFVFRLLPPRSDFPFTMTDGERATMIEHVAYWSELARRGTALAFGPVNDPCGPYGIGIILVEDLEAAESLRDRDPAVSSPYGFRTEIAPMLSLVTRDGRFDAI